MLPTYPQRSLAMYMEWAMFAILLCALISLWWVIEFGMPGSKGSDVPEQVINKLLAGSNEPQPIPQIVVRTLAAQPSSPVGEATLASAAGAPTSTPPMPPAAVMQFLRK